MKNSTQHSTKKSPFGLRKKSFLPFFCVPSDMRTRNCFILNANRFRSLLCCLTTFHSYSTAVQKNIRRVDVKKNKIGNKYQHDWKLQIFYYFIHPDDFCVLKFLAHEHLNQLPVTMTNK